jgi:hypothetical protein
LRNAESLMQLIDACATHHAGVTVNS